MYEFQHRSFGYQHIVGMDEAGRGTWAGPVSVGACCLPLSQPKLQETLKGVRDSKQMTPRQRNLTIDTIKRTALAWGVGSASSRDIDEFGIVPATKLAMSRALDAMFERFPDFKPDCLFLDGMVWPERLREYPQISLIHGDERSLSIAAASVLAKVWRDELMVKLDAEYPQYGFGIHKGYGTAKHRAALLEFGPCALHRMTFKPVLEAARSRNPR
jgi:ribonuclease HII